MRIPMRAWVSKDAKGPGATSLWGGCAPVIRGNRYVEGQFTYHLGYVDAGVAPDLKPGECVECELTLKPIKEA